MKNKINKNIRLNYSLKLFQSGELVLNTFSSKKLKILNLARSTKWELAEIKVTYCSDFWNEGSYSTYAELKRAISIFTEPNLTSEFNKN